MVFFWKKKTTIPEEDDSEDLSSICKKKSASSAPSPKLLANDHLQMDVVQGKGVKRGRASQNESPEKRLRITTDNLDDIADELYRITKENESLKEESGKKDTQCDDLKKALKDREYSDSVNSLNHCIVKNENNRLRAQVAELEKKLGAELKDSRKDKTTIQTLQKENEDLKKKVEKARSGWEAFMEFGDMFKH